MAAKIVSSQRLAISGSPARSAQLDRGHKYAVTASADCTIRQGASNVDAAADTANNWFLPKGAVVELMVSDASDGFISVVGTSGSLYIARLDGA
jgi:hypothetical protein